MKAYKLLRLRKNGTMGPLFINCRQVIPVGEWLQAEDHPTKGYAHRPGWHICPEIKAPHLTMKGRIWCEVEIEDFVEESLPALQGGNWYIAQRMRVVRQLPGVKHDNPFDRQ